MLQDAIEHEDWELVKDAYRMLGGVIKEKPNKPKKTRRRQPKVEVKSESLSRSLTLGRAPKLVDVKSVGRGKKFITPPLDTSERVSRPSARKVKVVCDYCGRTETISDELAPTGRGEERTKYRCQSCYGG